MNSQNLFNDAKTILVGGVNSPVRAFKSVGGTPIFFKEAHGAHLISEEGKTYIDYVLSWGPMLLGHSHPSVVQAVTQMARKGFSFGAPTSSETQLAHLVQHFFPSMQKMRFVSTGTEATSSAIRLARGFTKRKLIVKFEGCYHGHVDSLLVSAGSGSLTFSQPDSEGVLPELAAFTRVIPFNDIAAVKALFTQEGPNIAAVIVEPVCGNMGVITPNPGFLETLSSLCTQYESLLIFDEVMTGFRVHQGGAQALFNITPDLTCLGKVVGGGLPAAVYGGKAEIMSLVSPEGGVYQAGTLSGSPLAMAAGIATLSFLKASDAFNHAKASTDTLVEGIKLILRQKNLDYPVNHCGTMFSTFFCPNPVSNLNDTKTVNKEHFNRFYHSLLQQGVYMAPSAFEANFLSAAHTAGDIDTTLKAISKSL